MLFKNFLALLVLVVAESQGSANSRRCAGSSRCHKDCGEDLYRRPSCSTLHENVVTTGGTLYTVYELHYNLMMSNYYARRMADALGYNDPCRANSTTWLKDLDIMTPWSGKFGGIAYDAAKGFPRTIARNCTFPTPANGSIPAYPFLCTGDLGMGVNARGNRLGTISYIPLLHDDVYHRWTLFGQCFNPPRPSHPNAVPYTTSFNFFSLDETYPPGVRDNVTSTLDRVGFSIDEGNIIESNYSSPVIPPFFV